MALSAFEGIDFLESPPPPTMTTAPLQPVQTTKPSPSPSPPNLGRKTSLIDLKDWVVDDGHFKSPTPKSMANDPSPPPPLIDLHSPPRTKPKPKPKPAILSSKPPQLPPRKSPSHSSLRSSAAAAAPQLNFLYPPRRQDSFTVDQPHSQSSSGHAPSSSISSFHSVSLSSDTDTTAGSISNFVATFPIDRERSWSSATQETDSLSLTESYEDVSASSALASPVTVERIEWQYATRKMNLPPKLPDRPPTASKPSSFTKNLNLKASPSLPACLSRSPSIASGSVPSSPIMRPSLSRHSSVSTLNNTSTVPPYSPYTPRRAAPPPPPTLSGNPPPPIPSRSSDRSSILSSTTSHSLSSHSSSSPSPTLTSALRSKRPTPVPLAARKRYEVLFARNVIQREKVLSSKDKDLKTNAQLSPPAETRNRRAAGWRGLSVDLITGVEEFVGLSPQTTTANRNGDLEMDHNSTENVYEAVGSDAKLEGPIVKFIWKKSGLESMRLAEIWCVTLCSNHSFIFLT